MPLVKLSRIRSAASAWSPASHRGDDGLVLAHGPASRSARSCTPARSRRAPRAPSRHLEEVGVVAADRDEAMELVVGADGRHRVAAGVARAARWRRGARRARPRRTAATPARRRPRASAATGSARAARRDRGGRPGAGAGRAPRCPDRARRPRRASVAHRARAVPRARAVCSLRAGMPGCWSSLPSSR